MSEIRERLPIIELGTANGWSETPRCVSECLEKKHTLKQTGVGRCLTKVSCDICNYVYLIDSSD